MYRIFFMTLKTSVCPQGGTLLYKPTPLIRACEILDPPGRRQRVYISVQSQPGCILKTRIQTLFLSVLSEFVFITMSISAQLLGFIADLTTRKWIQTAKYVHNFV